MKTDQNLQEISAKIDSQRKKLKGFVENFLPSLNYAQAIEYLKNWEQTTCQELKGFVSPKKIEKISSVWLSQRFELPQEEQIYHLIRLFEEAVRSVNNDNRDNSNLLSSGTGVSVVARLLKLFKRR